MRRTQALIVTVHGGPESHIPNGWVTRYSYPGQVAAGRNLDAGGSEAQAAGVVGHAPHEQIVLDIPGGEQIVHLFVHRIDNRVIVGAIELGFEKLRHPRQAVAQDADHMRCTAYGIAIL